MLAMLVLVALLGAAIAADFDNKCGQVFTKKQFILESPGYPSNYPTNFQCYYLLKGPSCPTYFNLQFLDFNLEDSVGCTKDRLEIDDQDALCGNKNTIKTYFAPKGTLHLRLISDGDVSGRGYRVLVTRLPCNDGNAETTVSSAGAAPKCCPNSYNTKRFVLTSPNYPNSLSTPADCVYEIHKYRPDVCRLRIHAHFFWLGQTNDCSQDFVKVDNKVICGCKQDLKLMTQFEDSDTKLIRFSTRGLERRFFGGFVLEIFQDECPKKYVPGHGARNLTFEEKFRFYNDQINRIAWPNDSDKAPLEKLKLVSASTEILDDQDKINVVPRTGPDIVKSVYFFIDEDPRSRDREETNYVDTAVDDSSFPDTYDYNSCLNWNQLQFDQLARLKLETCRTNQGNVVPPPSSSSRNCVDLNFRYGFFRSPGYPFYYPGNLDICYRFRKQPGFCTVRVYMKDFQLQSTPDCRSDFLLLRNQQRFCGSRLANTALTLDLRTKEAEDVIFMTDAFYCGRGFFGVYEQLPCGELTTTPSYRPPITPPVTPPPSPPPPHGIPCGGFVQEQQFTLQVFDYDGPTCSFQVRKYAQDVCEVRLVFDKFDLYCAVESLVIGGTMYCGKLSGQSVTIDVRYQDSVLRYRKITNEGVPGLRLRITGTQLRNSCPYPEVPAERLLGGRNLDLSQSYLLKLQQRLKSICGIVTNRDTNLPSTFCHLIKRSDPNVTQCVPLAQNFSYVPLESQIIKLKENSAIVSHQINLQVIDCDKIVQ